MAEQVKKESVKKATAPKVQDINVNDSENLVICNMVSRGMSLKDAKKAAQKK